MYDGRSGAGTGPERLGALYRILPEMEQKSERLLRSRAAAEAVTLYNRYRSLHLESALLQTEAKRKRADDQGFIASLLPAREKAAADMKESFEACLRKNGFRSLEDAKAAVLPPETDSALAAEIDEYKREYAALVEQCGEALNRAEENDTELKTQS